MTVLMVIMALTNAVQLKAQQKMADKELIGVWVMEYFLYDSGEKISFGNTFTAVKVYRADGEYACAQIAREHDGTPKILPHEYGTYTFKDGKYTEMGRDGGKEAIIFDDKTHFHGRFMNRYEGWKKKTDMPSKLVDYIVAKCKAKQEGDPKDIQQMIEQHVFK